jgi:hypothetical protein
MNVAPNMRAAQLNRWGASMRSLLLRLGTVAALAVSPLALAAPITARQARELPTLELSHLALGEAGDLMIDVERLGSAVQETPDLRFFGRAVVTGSQFGLCGSDWVTLHLDEGGSVESVDAERRFGVEGQIYRKPGEWTYDESDSICKAVKSTKSYFPAPGPQEALEIALYIDAIAGTGPFATQNFKYQCEGLCGAKKSVLSYLQLRKIDRARTIDCDGVKLKLPSCFEVVVGEYNVGAFPMTFRIYGSNFMNRVIVSAIRVSVRSTSE